MHIHTESKKKAVGTEPHTSFILHHAGVGEHLGGTHRVLIWFDAEPTQAYINFLDLMVDKMSIQGIEGVLKSKRVEARIELIVSDRVFPNSAGLWIKAVNEHLAQQPNQFLQGFNRNFDSAEVISADSANGTESSTSILD